MLAYYEKRKQELIQAQLQLWVKRGQAAKDLEDTDAEIEKNSHRLDEINRSITAQKAAIEEDKKQKAEKQATTDKGGPEIVQPCASGEATGALEGDSTT
jgi:chromosome segregation ATPase